MRLNTPINKKKNTLSSFPNVTHNILKYFNVLNLEWDYLM